MKSYDHGKIEKKWQKEWAKKKLYKTKEPRADDSKFYILDMFPYPSGEGLHVGHPKGYIATDILSRMKRMQSYNVLHPMGFDAFGLPAENYALKTKTNPSVSVAKNVTRYKKQLEILGLDYDWSREINTTDPEYYRWTQWIFLKLFEKGLAYESYEPINWCPVDKTGLANEDVEDGKCERCGAVVEKKPMRQWVLRITDYAERLLADLDESEGYMMPELVDNVNPHQEGKPLVSRQVAHAIVYDPKHKKYLIIRNKKFGWDTVVIGGIEGNESPTETAVREVREETGYTDLEFKRILGGPTRASYYAKHKGENRVAIATAVYFELKSDARVALADGEDKDNEILWVSEKDFVPGKMVNSELHIWLERIKDSKKGWGTPLLLWPESIKDLQRHWIGKSEGAEIPFEIVFSRGQKPGRIPVYTTRPDTIFGVTYMVLSPEHPWVTLALDDAHKGVLDNRDDVKKYVDSVKNKTEIERTAGDKEKTGVELKGVKAVNPATGEKVPLFVADYCLPDYGTGAVMGVPAHDERDFAFAKKYKLPVKEIDLADKKEIISKYGKAVTKYKLRNWVFSRQRYWGEPIPVIHCGACGVVPVPEKDLPVVLPKVKSYEPTGTGESPLASISKWVNVPCPKCKGKAKRETNTMPQWAGSSWYYLRFMDPKNSKAMVGDKAEKYFAPVDHYVGGAEHATRHLIYARFWHKFLYDQGLVSTKEPFTKLSSVGLIMGEDGRKMSKRFGNVVNPDDIVSMYGADTLRVYEMFMGPFDQAISWNTDSIIGSRRFLERVWRLHERVDAKNKDILLPASLHKTIKKVGEDIEEMKYNTAISAMMVTLNELEKLETIPIETYTTFLRILAPFAPHMTEELWYESGGKGSIHTAPWPSFDTSKLEDDVIRIAVQVNGKVRATLDVGKEEEEEEVKSKALALPDIMRWIENKKIVKIIFVKGKILNIVVSEPSA